MTTPYTNAFHGGNAMGLRIQTNLQSMNAQRNLTGSSQINAQAMERLSSGFRINRAADDAAGLAISEKLKADVRSLNVAKRNANDGISMVQTAEGGLNEIGNILSRLRELSVQAASDTIGNTERGFLNKEYVQLKDEVERITRSLEYNGTILLAGGNREGISEEVTKNANQSPLEIQVGKNWYASTDQVGNDGGNPTNVIRIDLSNINTNLESPDGLGIGTARDVSENSTHVETKDNAQRSINVVDTALSKVSGYRAYLGAIQSRLSSTINNLSIQTENAAAANSRIRDTDFAEESARMTQSQIIKQAGVAVLAQANQEPQAALKLLG